LNSYRGIEMKFILIALCAVLLMGCAGSADYTAIAKAEQLCGQGNVKQLYINGMNGGDVRIDCLDGTSAWADSIEWKEI
jgi:hypothetical protein